MIRKGFAVLATLEPVTDQEEKTAATAPVTAGPFQDIPKAIWVVFLSLWATLFGLFALFFATDRSAAFVVVISLLFVFMAFGLPISLAAQGRRDGYECPELIETGSGKLTAWEAGAQIVSIPAAGVLALMAFILLAK
jgi:hypothetical protein